MQADQVQSVLDEICDDENAVEDGIGIREVHLESVSQFAWGWRTEEGEGTFGSSSLHWCMIFSYCWFWMRGRSCSMVMSRRKCQMEISILNQTHGPKSEISGPRNGGQFQSQSQSDKSKTDIFRLATGRKLPFDCLYSFPYK